MSDSEPKEIETLLEEIPLNLLKEYMDGNDIKGKKTNKKVAVEAILEHAQKKGESTFIKELEKDALKMALEEMDKKVESESKQKLAKSFKSHFSKQKDKAKYFQECSLELLTKFLAALGMEEDSSKEEKADAVMEELLITGLKLGFTAMAKEFINDVCDALKISKSGTKKACVNRIIGQSYPHYLEANTPEKEEREKNDITKIKEGITFEDLYQFYAEELVEFAKQNGLKKTGSKKIMCKRILKFLAGDETTTKPLKPGQRHKKKKGGKKRKADEKEGEEKEDKEEEEEKEKEDKEETESKKKKTKK